MTKIIHVIQKYNTDGSVITYKTAFWSIEKALDLAMDIADAEFPDRSVDIRSNKFGDSVYVSKDGQGLARYDIIALYIV